MSGFAKVLDQMKTSGIKEKIVADIGPSSFLLIRRLAIRNTEIIERTPRNNSRLYDVVLLIPKIPNAIDIRKGHPPGSKPSSVEKHFCTYGVPFQHISAFPLCSMFNAMPWYIFSSKKISSVLGRAKIEKRRKNNIIKQSAIIL